jgi:hypothetical protein
MCIVNKNVKTVYYYSKKYNDTSFYEIKEFLNKNKNKFRTSVSLDNSTFQYVTHFDTISEALKYVSYHKIKNQDCL